MISPSVMRRDTRTANSCQWGSGAQRGGLAQKGATVVQSAVALRPVTNPMNPHPQRKPVTASICRYIQPKTASQNGDVSND